MNRNIHQQIAVPRGVDTRFPSTANLMIDSGDRSTGVAANFTIVPGQQMIMGAFTRAAVAEVVLEWAYPNVTPYVENNRLIVNSPVALDTYTTDVSGAVLDGVTPITDYYDPIPFDSGTVSRNPVILVNGLPTPIIPANLPLLDPEGAPIDINGAPIVGEELTVVLFQNFYTIAGLMDTFASLLTGASTGSFVTFTNTASSAFGCSIIATKTVGGGAAAITITPSYLSKQMGLSIPVLVTNAFYPRNPIVMPWRYVDIMCDQLTYCQDVKDSATGRKAGDVLNRWHFAWSAPPTNDKYGFPILQGYQCFTERRNIGFPKQIKWDPLQTIANLTFQSYVDYIDKNGVAQYMPVPDTVARTDGSPYEFQMTLLLSEV